MRKRDNGLGGCGIVAHDDLPQVGRARRGYVYEAAQKSETTKLGQREG